VNDPFLDKGLPSNPEAEGSCLGAILLDNEVCKQAIDLLRRDDFFLDSNRKIFDKMVRLHERGMPIDLITLTDELRQANEFEQIGGATYIASLIDGVPRTDTIEPYAKILKEKSILRAIIRRCNDTITRAYSEHDPDLLRDGTITALAQIESIFHPNATRNIFHARERKEHIKPADEVIKGVASRRQVVAVEGAPGAGKSTVLMDMVATAAQSCNILLITNESPEEADARLDAWCGFHNCDTPPGLHMLCEVAGLFDLSRVSSIIEAVKALGGVDLIALDILSNEFEGRKEDNENMAVAFAAAYQIARACDCAFILTAHTGWSGEHIRGGSQAYGSARRVFQVENNDEVITFKVQKANVTRAMEPRRFRILQVPLERVPNADARRAEEYTVLIPAESVLNLAGPISKQQVATLRVYALPVFAASGAYPKDVEAHKIPKSTINVATSALIKRGMVEDVPRKAGAHRITDDGLDYLKRLDDGQRMTRKPIEQALNKGGLNWTVCSQDSKEQVPFVYTSSIAVHSAFNGSGSCSVQPLPSKGGLNIEQAALSAAETTADQRKCQGCGVVLARNEVFRGACTDCWVTAVM